MTPHWIEASLQTVTCFIFRITDVVFSILFCSTVQCWHCTVYEVDKKRHYSAVCVEKRARLSPSASYSTAMLNRPPLSTLKYSDALNWSAQAQWDVTVIAALTLPCANNDCTARYPTANQCAAALHSFEQLLDNGPFSLWGLCNLIFLVV